MAGLNARATGRRLGIFKPHREKAKKTREKERGEEFWIEVCGRLVPTKKTEGGIRDVTGARVIEQESTRRYLESKVGDDLGAFRSAMPPCPNLQAQRTG